MNVLQIVQAACAELNIPQPSTVAGSITDPATLQLINLFYSVGRDLVESKCWPQLKRTHSFATVNGTSTYALPTDFHTSIFDSFWDTSNRRKLVGPLTDSQFDELLYGYVQVLDTEAFRIFGRNGTNQFQVTPTPGATSVTIKWDYISNAWIMTGASTWGTAITLDADTVAFDDDIMINGLKAEWCAAKGLDGSRYDAAYQKSKSTQAARWNGSKRTQLGVNGRFLNQFFNYPDGGYTF